MGSDAPEVEAAVGQSGGTAPWNLRELRHDIAMVIALRREFLRIVKGWYPVRNTTYDRYFCNDPQSGDLCVATGADRMSPTEGDMVQRAASTVREDGRGRQSDRPSYARHCQRPCRGFKDQAP
jgi:hypothetical protein